MDTKQKQTLATINQNLKNIQESISVLHHNNLRISDLVSNEYLLVHFGICKKTAYNWRKRGLKFRKECKKIFYHQADICSFLESKDSEYYTNIFPK